MKFFRFIQGIGLLALFLFTLCFESLEMPQIFKGLFIIVGVMLFGIIGEQIIKIYYRHH